MKYADINKRFTEIVSVYIGKGYTINTASMSGSQGEIGKVDLTNGIEIIRIYIDTFADWNHYYGLEGVAIVVGRSTDNVIPNSHSDFGTIWNSRLDIQNCERFYKIGNNRKSGHMFGTLEEAEAAINKRITRRTSRERKSDVFIPSPEMMAIAKRIVREKMGLKRICETDVKLTKYCNKYSVSYHNKSYTLH